MIQGSSKEPGENIVDVDVEGNFVIDGEIFLIFWGNTANEAPFVDDEFLIQAQKRVFFDNLHWVAEIPGF